MLSHCQGNIAVLTLFKQIFAAHQALEFREFTHHLADKIVLAEMGRTASMVCQ